MYAEAPSNNDPKASLKGSLVIRPNIPNPIPCVRLPQTPKRRGLIECLVERAGGKATSCSNRGSLISSGLNLNLRTGVKNEMS